MKLTEMLVADSGLYVREPVEREELLSRLAHALSRSAPSSLPDPARIAAELLRRERSMSTAFGLGVALPHCFIPGAGRPRLAIACSESGVDFGSPDGSPTYVLFLLVESSPAGDEHTKTLSRIARLCRDTRIVPRLREARDPAAYPPLLAEEERTLD